MSLRAEAPDAVGAEIAFAGNGVAAQRRGLGIGRAAEAARLLGAEPDDADGAQRPAGVHDVLGGRRRDRDAGAIVDRAGALVPAVEVAADQQDRRLGIAAGDFGDDIARMAALALLADEGEVHGHGPAALEDADQLLGVGDGQRAGRDRLRAVGEILDPGVRIAVMVGADRADDDRDRALLARRWSGPGGAGRRTGRSPSRPGARHHVMVDEDDLAAHRAVGRGAQGIDAVEIDDLAGDALGPVEPL